MMENQLKQSEAIDMSVQNVSKVLLEVLVYGEEKDKDKLNQFMEDIQEQIKTSKQDRRVRILFYIDKGEKSNQEKEKWLIGSSVCKYYNLINPRGEDSLFKGFVVPKDYIKHCMKNIKTFEESYSKMKELGVKIKR